MKIVKRVPAILSFLILGAHFFRAGQYPLLVLNLVCVPLLFLRRKPVTIGLQIVLVAGALEWLLTIFNLIAARSTAGHPWHRMAAILGSVAVFNLISAWLLHPAKGGAVALTLPLNGK